MNKLTETQVNAVKALVQAKAFHELMKERTAPIHAELLAVWKPITEGDSERRPGGEPITDWARLYRTDDATFTSMMADRESLLAKAGISASKPGNCPLLEAEHLVRLAEHGVILAFSEFCGGKPITVNGLLCLGLEKYDRFVELCCQLVASHPVHSKKLALV